MSSFHLSTTPGRHIKIQCFLPRLKHFQLAGYRQNLIPWRLATHSKLHAMLCRGRSSRFSSSLLFSFLVVFFSFLSLPSYRYILSFFLSVFLSLLSFGEFPEIFDRKVSRHGRASFGNVLNHPPPEYGIGVFSVPFFHWVSRFRFFLSTKQFDVKVNLF